MLFQNLSRKHSNITCLLRKKIFKKKDVFLPVHKYRITNTFCTVFSPMRGFFPSELFNSSGLTCNRFVLEILDKFLTY